MRYRALAVLSLAFVMALVGVVWVAAQDAAPNGSTAACAPAVINVWTAASNACISGPAGYICNGGIGPQAEPAGQVSNALSSVGAMVDLKTITSLHTSSMSADGSAGGLAWIRSPDPLAFTGLLVGDVQVSNVTPDGFPAWQAMTVQTSPTESTCGAAPYNAFVVQSPQDQPANLAINGVSLGLNGTVLIETTTDTTYFAGLSGESTVFAAGLDQTLRPGQQVGVGYSGGSFTTPATAPSDPVPLNETMIQNFPVALLDRPIILPQPGYVSTDGAVNLRTAPSTDAGVIVQVPGGQVLSVLGRDTTGQWYHVRLDDGETGWMFAQLLLQNVGDIQAVYDSTPLPPQRYGDLGKTAKILAPAGVNLRQAPDVMFPLVVTIPDGSEVTLLARSPYSPWVKVDYNGTQGWVALVTIQTEAIIDALPIDYNVPPPPAPTRVPGSFGNAYPEPTGHGG